jgi:hypothetical protein
VTVEAINQAFDTPYQKSESEPQLDGQNKNGNFELENYCLQKLSGKGKFTFLPGGCFLAVRAVAPQEFKP